MSDVQAKIDLALAKNELEFCRKMRKELGKKVAKANELYARNEGDIDRLEKRVADVEAR